MKQIFGPYPPISGSSSVPLIPARYPLLEPHRQLAWRTARILTSNFPIVTISFHTSLIMSSMSPTCNNNHQTPKDTTTSNSSISNVFSSLMYDICRPMVPVSCAPVLCRRLVPWVPRPQLQHFLLSFDEIFA